MSQTEKQEVNESVLKLLRDINSSRIREAEKRESVYTTVTTGALAISVSFLTISGFGNLVSENILIFSWISLLSAIILNLTSYVLVDFHFDKYATNLRKWRDDGMDLKILPKEKTVYGKITRILNNLSYGATIIGLIAMVIFGIKNINNMKKENNVVRGQDNQNTQGIQKTAEPATPGPSLSDMLANRPTEKKQ